MRRKNEQSEHYRKDKNIWIRSTKYYAIENWAMQMKKERDAAAKGGRREDEREMGKKKNEKDGRRAG